MVNTARDGIVDEAALYQVLHLATSAASGWTCLAGAGITGESAVDTAERDFLIAYGGCHIAEYPGVEDGRLNPQNTINLEVYD